MFRSPILLGSLVLFGLIVMLSGLLFPDIVAPVEKGSDAFFSATPTSLQSALAQASRDGKGSLLIMFEMDGCSECRQIKETVLRDPAVQDYYRRHFLSVSLNLLGSAPLTDFRGRALSQGEFALANRVQASPTFIFYDTRGAPVTRFTGAVRDAAEFLQLGRYVAEAAYENMPFQAYRQQAAQ